MIGDTCKSGGEVYGKFGKTAKRPSENLFSDGLFAVLDKTYSFARFR